MTFKLLTVALVVSSNLAAQKAQSADDKYIAGSTGAALATVQTKDINKLDENGLGPIHHAAINNQMQVLENLCNIMGIDLNLRDYFGRTAVHHAAIKAHSDCIKLLAQKGADLNLQDRIYFTKVLTTHPHKSNMHKWEKRQTRNYHGFTPFHYAALTNNRTTVTALLEAGAKPNIKDFYQQTPSELYADYRTTVYHQKYSHEFYSFLAAAETNAKRLELFKIAAARKSAPITQKLKEALGIKILPDLQKIILEYAQPTPEDLNSLGTVTRAGNAVRMFFGLAPALE